MLINQNISQSYQRNAEHERVGGKKKILATPKSQAGMRVVSLNDAALEALKEMKTRNSLYNITSNMVFPNYNGNYMCLRSVEKTFSKICDDMDVEYKGLHALRHTFGSILIDVGEDIKLSLIHI